MNVPVQPIHPTNPPVHAHNPPSSPCLPTTPHHSTQISPPSHIKSPSYSQSSCRSSPRLPPLHSPPLLYRCFHRHPFLPTCIPFCGRTPSMDLSEQGNGDKNQDKAYSGIKVPDPFADTSSDGTGSDSTADDVSLNKDDVQAIPENTAGTSSDSKGHDGSGSPPKKKKGNLTEVLAEHLADSQKELRQSQATLAGAQHCDWPQAPMANASGSPAAGHSGLPAYRRRSPEKWRAYQKDTFAVAMRYTTG
ncbi:Hypp8260 [Branchiostoma lanceolatum]|uniref:Hypp8260 protein n=1 Tax=Branchiostoma lanceolatum TaxID=7740 RepID=A0A8K0EHG5_BRALA|nr:Hypp8260 [Branchiostoma lanceolatum]